MGPENQIIKASEKKSLGLEDVCVLRKGKEGK